MRAARTNQLQQEAAEVELFFLFFSFLCLPISTIEIVCEFFLVLVSLILPFFSPSVFPKLTAQPLARCCLFLPFFMWAVCIPCRLRASWPEVLRRATPWPSLHSPPAPPLCLHGSCTVSWTLLETMLWLPSCGTTGGCRVPAGGKNVNIAWVYVT